MILRCREEVDQVLGSKLEITYDDITKLKYVGCVFKETLRIFPPVPSISRQTEVEMTIDGYKIPANTAMAVDSIWV